jgi:hypothetical protein
MNRGMASIRGQTMALAQGRIPKGTNDEASEGMVGVVNCEHARFQ